MLKSKHFYLTLAISLILILSLLLMGAGGCPSGDTYNLTTSVTPSGSGSVSPSSGSYDSGVTVTITATAASGYVFDYWSGSASGSSSTTSLVMDAHKSVIAHFEPIIQSYTLTTNVSPSGGGSVSPSGGTFDDGTAVTLSATAASGYVFDHWSGNASGTNPNTTIIMDSDKSVTAYFATAGPEVLFYDDFSDPNSGWVTYSASDGRVMYSNGCLYVKDYTAYTGTMFGEAQRYFTDFVIEVETWLVGGTDDNWHVVGCRMADYNNAYCFSISADGWYMIDKEVNGSVIPLVSPTTSYHINEGTGAVNLVRVECIGSSLSLYVNGYLLDTVYDSTFSGGDIFLGSNALSGSYTEVAFDNLTVTAS
jgi:uncharacterized repeat protein (TIGR02543 family)